MLRTLSEQFRRVVARSVAPGSGRMYVLVAVAVAVLFAATALVVDRFHRYRDTLARRDLQRGQALATKGEPEAAIRALRASLALDRGNTTTELALATTLLEAERPREARAYLGEVLRRDPTNGLANLMRARTARALGEANDAELYYRRAVYGEWPAHDAQRRLAVRFELVDFLLGRAARDRAQGELKGIEADAPASNELSARLGPLYLRAGASSAAATHLRKAVMAFPDDPALWAALNTAEFLLGHHAASIAAGKHAQELRPNAEVAARLEISMGVLALDPTARRLGRAERHRRARVLLTRTLTLLETCVPATEGPETSELARLRVAAHDVLDSRRRRPEDAADAVVDLAEYMWHATVTRCPAARDTDAILAQVMDQLTTAEGAQ